jgi:transcriptional regulator with XRE-family HTH domain
MTAATDLPARLGAVIRQRRALLGLSQPALAERVGVTFQQVQKYEKGTNQPTFRRLVDLANALGTTVGDLAASALRGDAGAQDGLSDRETLELMKWLTSLTPGQRRAVRQLVDVMAGAA